MVPRLRFILNSMAAIAKAKQKARDDFIEKISVAGWKEAFGEPIIWISHIFKIVLLVCSGLCSYYIYKSIITWIQSGYTDEISDNFEVESIPASNVTVCADVYFNQTFIKENVVIPPRIKETVDKLQKDKVDEFYRQLTLFLSISSRPQHFDWVFFLYFAKILRANPQINDFSTFASIALASCASMLKRCWFGGKEFDCCEHAVQSIDEDGICYVLALNFDSDNTAPSKRTFHQVSPGPSGGLTVEAVMPLKDFPWLQDEADDGFKADNGFRVYVNPVPYSMVQSPLGAPSGAETFIKVIPSKHGLAVNCAEYNQLSMPGGAFMYYDPEGVGCIVRELNRVIKRNLECEGPTYLHRPNSSSVCTPLATYIGESIFAASRESENAIASAVGGPAAEMARRQLQKLDKDLKKAMSERARCPNQCHYWAYSSTASFFYLENANGIEDNGTMRSKIHVYYGDLGYRQHQEVKQVTAYFAFGEFGNIVGFWWGMSIISFFHLGFYVPLYLRSLWKSHKERKVSPEN